MAFSTHDQVPDSPTNVFATLNTLNTIASGATVSDGNLNLSNTLTNHTGIVNNLAIPKNGRWYFEIIINSTGQTRVQLLENTSTIPTIYNSLGVSVSSSSSGNRTWYITSASWGGESTSHKTDRATPNYDIIRFFYDADNGNLWIGHNANWLDDTATTNSNSNPSTNAQPTLSSISSADYLLFLNVYQNNIAVNFGQDPTFGGTKSPSSTYTDANGIGQFYYDPPTGALALCTANLPGPVIDPNADDLPEDYFKAVKYQASNVNNLIQSVNVGFQPDLIWIKNRDNTETHYLTDTLRSSLTNNRLDKFLCSNETSTEATVSNRVTGTTVTLTSDGYEISDSNMASGELYFGTRQYICWAWKAGGAPTTDNTATSGAMTANSVSVDGTLQSSYTPSGSPTIYPKRMSVNTKAGFSIVKYVGDGNNNSSVPHGLSQTPDIIIIKNLDTTTNWYVNGYPNLSPFTSNNKILALNSALGIQTASSNASTNGTNVITINIAGGDLNSTATNYIAYCWHSVAGYSAFGSYISAGATSDSNFVYLGFKPALVILKATGAVSGFESYISWGIYDNARKTANPNHSPLFANKAVSEGYRGNGTTSTGGEGLIVDFLSNGFKLRQESAEFSGSNTNPIIYAAWAEQPFKYANAR